MNRTQQLLNKAIAYCGDTRTEGAVAIAKACGTTRSNVYQWHRRGLPRTEWTGETKYAQTIEKMTDGRVTKDELLRRR